MMLRQCFRRVSQAAYTVSLGHPIAASRRLQVFPPLVACSQPIKRWKSGDDRYLAQSTIRKILPSAQESAEVDDGTEHEEREEEDYGEGEEERDVYDKIKEMVIEGEMTTAEAFDEYMQLYLNYSATDYSSDLQDAPFPDFMATHGSVLNMINIEDMVKAGVHYGHHRSFWNPLMEPYIYGTRDDIHIFDLEQTAAHLRRALDVLRHIAYRGGIILFVGNRKQFEKTVRYTAIGCGEFYVTEKWRGGCLSNRRHMLRSEVMPDFVVLLTLPVSKGALNECNLMNIPSMAIVDSDQDPFSVVYPIPANDDTRSSVEYICNLMQKAVIEGKYCRVNRLNLVSAGATPEMPGVIAEPKSDTNSR